MSSDRTERPTARRLQEARRRGQLPRSRDLVQAGSLAFALMVLAWTGTYVAGGLTRAIANSLHELGRFPARDLAMDEVGVIALNGLATLTMLAAPVALAAIVAVIALFSAQGGWVFATEAMTLNFGKLNPANGIKRLGFSAGGIETIKMVLLVTALSYLSYRIIKANLLQSANLARLTPYQAAQAGWGDIERLLRQSAVLLVAVAAADYGVQKWRFLQGQKMTKQEVKDDTKLTEGNPEVKGRIRQIQMRMVRKRMLAAVPKATVVITNPTHYAVALEYRRGVMVAPKVVAKGRGLVAQRIKTIAREAGVPMVENVPLAQALYKTVEIGESIPAALFEAVAEVLAYLIRLRRLAV